MHVIDIKDNDNISSFLVASDEKLKLLINNVEKCNFKVEDEPFYCLTKYIIGQQISDNVRETIWQRLLNTVVPLTPINIIDSSVESLRSLGISQRKIEYIKELAENIVQKRIDFKEIKKLSNEEIIRILTDLRGIGIWTAEMFLIFCLQKPNVLSKSDGTIKRTIKWMYDLNDFPSESKLETIFEKWEGYETYVSLYLWATIEYKLINQPFDNLKCF